MLNVLSHRRSSLLFRTIRWSHRAGDDDREIKIPCDVFLVAVEAFRLALSTMTHLGVFY